MTGGAIRTAGFLAVLLLAGCAETSAPRWIRLARETPRFESPSTAGAPNARVSKITDDEGTWLEVRLSRADWRRAPVDGRWTTKKTVRAIGRGDASLALYRIRFTGGEYEHRSRGELAPGTFMLRRGALVLQLEEGAEPPEEAVLLANAARRVQDDAGTWRVRGARFDSDGLALTTGERCVFEIELPSACALRFGTCIEPIRLDEAEVGADPVVFRVLQGDELLFEESRPPAESIEWHEVELVSGGASAARLTFEIEGPLAYTSFATPVVGPLETGGFESRPWGSDRPDVICFLADTFRADNLAAYGGDPALAPVMNRFAEECLRFQDARSVSTHTLPTHASMFTGLFPSQTCVVDQSTALSPGARTVAEVLSEAGYRTVAVTDGVMISAIRGMEQGFEWFDGHRGGIDSTVERVRAVLDSDDGRPLFLFVQTYETHVPYEITEETRRSHGDRLELHHDFYELDAVVKASFGEYKTPDLEQEGVREAIEGLHQLYLGGVVDLDRGFESFLGALDERGLRDSGFLIFTSDHGEAFCEHGQVWHGGVVHEEQIKVPLLLRGPGLSPGVSPWTASLIDFAPTVAEMAGLRADPAWLGTSWLSLEGDRPTYAFQSRTGAETTMTVVDGSRKIILVEDLDAVREGLLLEAYDLERDPGEAENLLGDELDWPDELVREHAKAFEILMLPLLDADSPLLSGEARDELEALGYGGGR